MDNHVTPYADRSVFKASVWKSFNLVDLKLKTTSNVSVVENLLIYHI